MDVKQVYAIANDATAQALGEKAVEIIDAATLVDAGRKIFDANAVEPYAKALVNVIGRDVFVNRPYTPVAPSVYMDSWEYGSVMRKSQVDMPNSTVNESWELQGGASYDPNIFYTPVVTVKYYNQRSTFEVPISITEDQIKQSFRSAEDLNGFISMIFTAVENAVAVRIQELTMATVGYMIGATLQDAYPDPGDSTPYTGAGNTRAINLLALYKAANAAAETMTPAQAIKDPEFLRFAALNIGLTADRMRVMSTLFNIEGKERHTPASELHILMLSEFARGADIYLQSTTFHDELTALPAAEKMPYWQGPGVDYGFDSTSKIHTQITAQDGSTEEVVASGILAVMWDRYALGVTNFDRRTTTNYNAKAEFMNYWFKSTFGMYGDTTEQFVVFFVA